MMSGRRNEPRSRPAPRVETIPRAEPLERSINSTRPRLCYHRSPPRARDSPQQTPSTIESRSPRRPLARSSSRLTGCFIAPTTACTAGFGQQCAAEIGMQHGASEVKYRRRRLREAWSSRAPAPGRSRPRQGGRPKVAATLPPQLRGARGSTDTPACGRGARAARRVPHTRSESSDGYSRSARARCRHGDDPRAPRLSAPK